ncbi:CRISPR-associated helicase Cas3' [Chryseobacterium sp.]|uniref:CRISPR-associated helicase Cas3' n=1 Tax=Chryseobacterium sp. TaxID=1871047 RepID=UPI0038900B7B
MKDLKDILAKSVLYGGTDLLTHTEQVVLCIAKMAQGFQNDFDLNTAQKGAILHDLGKAHPVFQKKVSTKNKQRLLEEFEDSGYVHRHEISSLAFLPCFPKEDWDNLIEMVVGHHKSIEAPNNDGRGILDLKTQDRYWIRNHLIDWEIWQQYGLQIIESFGFECPNEISIEEAQEALMYVADYCENKRNGWSPYRGLLKSADHFASALVERSEENIKTTFETPDLSFYRDSKRKNDLYPLSKVDTDDKRRHTLVVAPTGAGKTDFLMKRTKGRIFYTLPFQASINAMWARFKDVVPNKDIRILHAISKIIVEKNNQDEQLLQPLVGSAIKVLTPYQLAGIVFGISGFESILLDIKGCDVILDEVHTYSGYSRSMVLEVVKVLKHFECNIHIGTATMPTVLYNELLSILGGAEQVFEIKLNDEVLDKFNRHNIFKQKSDDEVFSILKNSIESNEKVLVVCNTIKKAQELYKTILEDFPNTPKMLIHSRFKRIDRFGRELDLKEKFNGDGKENKGISPCIVVATQVVEVSLDISFDRMITECAPLDGMIQRFGRVNRIRTQDSIKFQKPIHVIEPKGNVLPYKLELLQKSFEQLPDNGEVLLEKNLQEKIDCVYTELEKKEIDIHLKFKDGQFTMKELTDNRKGILIDALEIEGATCILEIDRQKYIDANWEERINMEIPINWKTISRYKKQFEQLNVGSNPFVIPQQEEDYQQYGLQLVEHDIIL